MSQSTAEIQQFFDGQEIYLTVIRENYMKHREIIDWIEDHCKRFGSRGIRVLEVGCGDAYVLSEVAQRIRIESYVGIDLAENSVTRARMLLTPWVNEVELIQGDFSQVIGTLDSKFDLILAGYVVHHLLLPEKNTVFGTFRQLLADDGALILYDVTKNEEDSREEYNDRTIEHYRSYWTALTSEQLDAVRQHVTTYDYPETSDAWTGMASENGLELVDREFLDEARFFSIMVEFIGKAQ
jgi:ubiquinone/menaquinone biosynthesis C-methylase UbiE